MEQLQRGARVTYGFYRPVVGVVDDTAGLVRCHRLALHLLLRQPEIFTLVT